MSDHASEGASASDPAVGIAKFAAPNAIARLVNLDPGLFAFSVTGAAPWRGAESGLALPAVHVCPLHADRNGAVEITTASGKPGAWLGGQADVLFVRSPAGGSAALVTAYLGRDPAGPSLALAIRRLDRPPNASGIAADELPVMTVSLVTPMAATRPPEEIGLEILLHIRERGDVYFFEPGWAGRVGAGSWVEAFAILPQHALAASAIEYKGLSASGVETAWLPSGSRCGTSGRSTPLLGFAVRQKAGVAGARFDCEYSGYFQSGTISGPARNGAPCLSTADNDPLEGLQLRIIDRSARE
jgi:hypothetical protein